MQSMRCAVLIEPPITGAFPCPAPTLWPERLSAGWSWSPWRSKWNHMGEPDSGAWLRGEVNLGSAAGTPVRWMVTAAGLHLNVIIIHACAYLNRHALSSRLPACTHFLYHTPSHPLRGFCGCSALKSGQLIRSIYRRASLHANNTKHTNGRERQSHRPQTSSKQQTTVHKMYALSSI